MSTRKAGARRTRRAPTALALAVCLVFGACGSDSDSDASSPSSATIDKDVLGSPDPATRSPVKIGFANAEGGATVSLPEFREGAEAAVDYANEHLGGLAGHRIELDACADKSDGASGTACANQFVQNDVVAVAVGSLANPDLYIPVLEGADIPWVRLQATGSGAVLTSPISFAINGGFIVGYAAVAAVASERGFERVVYFSPDVPAVTEGFESLGLPSFDAAGVEAELIGIPLGTPDVSSQVAAGMASDPDMLVLIADAALCQALLPAVRSANTRQVPVVIGDTCLAPDVLDAIGPDTVEGALDFTAYAGGDNHESELFRAVLDEYSSAEPVGNVAAGYGAVLAIVRAVNQVMPSEVTAASVLDAMRSAEDVPQPATPDATFTCDGQAFPRLPALCSTEVVLATVRNGVPTDPEVVDASEFLPAAAEGSAAPAARSGDGSSARLAGAPGPMPVHRR